MTGEKGSKKGSKAGASGLEFAGAGLQFAVIVVASALGGIWIDRKVGTSPWLLLVLVFGGSALGFYSLYRKLMKGQRLGDRRQASDRRDPTE